MENLQSITGMEYLNTGEVTVMTDMFYDCELLTGLDVSNFNTANVTTMHAMFYGCSSLTSLDVSHFNTANVTDMSMMFGYCKGLISLDLSRFNTSNVTDMSRMFNSCVALTRLDLSRFNTSNVTNMYWMFFSCPQLKNIYVGSGWSTAAVTNSDDMFWGCTNLVGGLGTAFDASHVDKAYAHIDGGTSDPGYFTDIAVTWNYDFVVDGIYYKITGTNTVSVTYKDSNYNCYSGDVVIPATVVYEGKTYTVTKLDNIAFLLCSGLTSVTIPETVSSIGNGTFKDCTSLTSIIIPSSVTTIGVSAFQGCTALKDVTLGRRVSSIGVSAFQGCTALELGNIYSLNPVPPTLTSSTFDTGHYQGANVYVPYGYLNFYEDAPYWQNFYDMYWLDNLSLDQALNVDGGTIHFTTGSSYGDYEWFTVTDSERTYAQSGNACIDENTSTLTATVTVATPSTLSFDFKAWGESNQQWIYDECVFKIDGVAQFTYGARMNHWETYTTDLAAGTHTLTWDYIKDSDYDPYGDFFSIDNVAIVSAAAVRGDVDGSGSVNISDVTTLIDYLLSGNASGVNLTAADCDQSGSINISDVTALIDYLLSGTW